MISFTKSQIKGNKKIAHIQWWEKVP